MRNADKIKRSFQEQFRLANGMGAKENIHSLIQLWMFLIIIQEYVAEADK